MNLVWKLLRQHISIPQFAGFAFANLFGMLIVLFGFQFYKDVLPVFTQEDSFMKADYLIMSKKIGMGNTISGRSNTFSGAEIDDVSDQKFVKKVGKFTSTEYKVDAQMGVNGVNVLNSELFFESVPDGFVDVPLKDWKYTPGAKEVPIILPRTYINMYNFGFAQSHSLPKISDGLMGMIDFNIQIQAAGKKEQFRGKVIGFSSRLNTILVPQAFMDWSNQEFAPNQKSDPNRLIVEVGNPGDESITKYLDDNGYEVETDKLDAEKTTYFLRMMVSLVMIIGLVISILSFYILMLSIYLLVQKNSSKLENLLLIGYSPNDVAKPYQVLTISLNVVVLIIAWVILFFVRGYYMDFIEAIFPDLNEGTMLPAICLGLVLFLIVSILNIVAIRRKVMSVYGDSLMKGTLPDEQLRYHFHTDLFEAPLAGIAAEVTNKSVFGATSRKGVTLVQRDLARGHRYDWALIEYGGNDCNYDWADVAAHPEQHHDPVVLADEFRANLTSIVQMLREAGVRPIFTTLPPIDEVKYLACIDHNGASAAGVMQWLGDVRRIYRTQERYSGLVRTIAAELDVPCVDPRERFLNGVDPRVSNADDGIHLSEAGYEMFYATLIEQVRAVIV